jgi:hypothetical protein
MVLHHHLVVSYGAVYDMKQCQHLVCAIICGMAIIDIWLLRPGSYHMIYHIEMSVKVFSDIVSCGPIATAITCAYSLRYPFITSFTVFSIILDYPVIVVVPTKQPLNSAIITILSATLKEAWAMTCIISLSSTYIVSSATIFVVLVTQKPCEFHIS